MVNGDYTILLNKQYNNNTSLHNKIITLILLWNNIIEMNIPIINLL